MEKFKKHGVYESALIEDSWDSARKAPVGVKWGDANKGDDESPEHLCRFGAKDIMED